MEHNILYFSAWLGSWFLAIRITWWFFNKEREDTLRPEIKIIISNWLKNIKLEKEIANWPMTFAAVFDGIFGKKHFTRRCIIGSCIASFVAVLILTFFWWMTRPDDFYGIFSKTSLYEFLLIYLLITIFLNSIADYFSLLETRWIIDRIKDTNSTPKICGFLAIDFVATVFIFLAVMTISLFPIIYIVSFFPENYGSNGYFEMLSHYWGELYYAITLNSECGNDITVGVWLYSTFFTSIWVWLYFLSGLIVKIIVFLAKLLGWTIRILDIDNKPLRSIGVVCVVIVSVIFLSAFIYITIKTTEREVIKPQAETIIVPVGKELKGINVKNEIKGDSLGGFVLNNSKGTPVEEDKINDLLAQTQTKKQELFSYWYKKGEKEYKKEGYDDAITSFTEALDNALDPAGKAYTHNYRGTAYLILRRYEEALADYDMAIDLNISGHELPHYNKGIIDYIYLGQYEEAKTNLKKAIDINPKYINSYVLLSEMNIIEGDYKSALDTIKKTFSFQQKAEDVAILLYIRCIAMKLLDMDASLYETELNKILKMDFTISKIFELSESWFKDANIDYDTKKYIKEKAELLKQKQ